MGDFFNFRKMITPALIKFLFVLGLLVIVVFSFMMASDTNGLSLLLLLVGPLIWRMSCESIILFFSIHEELVKFNAKSNPSSYVPENSQPNPQSPKASVSNKPCCKSCGEPIQGKNAFCMSCGEKLE